MQRKDRPNKQPKAPTELPILPVRDTVLFPNSVLPLTVGRASSTQLIETLSGDEKVIAVVAQRDARMDNPGPLDLYQMGTAALVHKVIRMPNQTLFVFVEGLYRIHLGDFLQLEPFLRANVSAVEDLYPKEEELYPKEKDAAFAALERTVQAQFQEVVSMSPTLSEDLQTVALNIDDPSRLADYIASTLPSLSTVVRQELLETIDVRVRLERLNRELAKERQVLELRNKIQSHVQEQVGQSQREYMLREQLKAIQKELGEGDESQREIEELRQKIEAAGMSEDVKKEALRELSRLAKMSPGAPEYTVARTYLDWLIVLPWTKSSGTAGIDIPKAHQILEEDHYNLEKVKERILDYLAVKKLQPNMKGPILCFVGPPGVGKTSLGKSIARALGRQFVRLSLGGIHDEAEIRGHRRTYIGALPGQIIQGIRRAETNDPVFMLDEVDKLGRDFRGDPASALLEVLDPEQNASFRDNYLDVPFDLSKVLFITTANYLDPIPEPLHDRMETLELPGYTEDEKIAIAEKYLIPKQTKQNGLEEGTHIEFEREALAHLIRHYTREAGVRNLEREIATLCRKRARRLAEGDAAKLVVTPDVVRELLGVERYRLDLEVEERVERPGVAVGLAWTPTGGDVLFVEAARMPRDKGEFTITGHVGEVMQESMKAALSWLRANSKLVGIDRGTVEKWDIHIHVPSGAIPKDGPSAGVTMVTALVSLFQQKPVRPRVAMTGEITLSGLVLPVGGIKEKVLAAKRAGIKEVILPAENKPNADEDLPAHLRGGLTLHFAKTIDQVLEIALGKPRAEEAKPELLRERA